MFRAQSSNDQGDDDQTKHPSYCKTVSKMILHGISLKSIPFMQSILWVIQAAGRYHTRNNAERLPKCHRFLKEPNLLINREMRRGEIAQSFQMPRRQCRICGSVPVLRHQFCGSDTGRPLRSGCDRKWALSSV